jgi:hypothetical protein
MNVDSNLMHQFEEKLNAKTFFWKKLKTFEMHLKVGVRSVHFECHDTFLQKINK